MAITFKKLVSTTQRYLYDASVPSYSLLSANWPPAAAAAVGDALVFFTTFGTGGQFSGMQFDITTPVSATQFEGVWEYIRRTGPSATLETDHEWVPLSNVVDNTVGFTVGGVQDVTWDCPEDWDNYVNPRGQATWYAFYVRFRITAIAGVTVTGAVASHQNLSHAIYFDSSENMESIFQASEANGWGVVSKGGGGQYAFNCSLYADVGGILTSKNEQVLFKNGFGIRLWQPYQVFGELNAQGYPVNGSSFIFEENNSDYSSTFLIGDNSDVFDTKIRFVPKTGVIQEQGGWGMGIVADNKGDYVYLLTGSGSPGGGKVQIYEAAVAKG